MKWRFWQRAPEFNLEEDVAAWSEQLLRDNRMPDRICRAGRSHQKVIREQLHCRATDITIEDLRLPLLDWAASRMTEEEKMQRMADHVLPSAIYRKYYGQEAKA